MMAIGLELRLDASRPAVNVGDIVAVRDRRDMMMAMPMCRVVEVGDYPVVEELVSEGGGVGSLTCGVPLSCVEPLVLTFECQPYHRGKLRVTSAVPEEGRPGCFELTGELEDATERNRLFGAVSFDPMAGSFTIPRASARDIARGHVIYVYPV